MSKEKRNADPSVPQTIDPRNQTERELTAHGNDLREEDIAALAYELWQARGCPDGSPRHRDENGQTREKNSNTRIDTLRDIYGPDFAPGMRGDAHLGTLLDHTGSNSLSDYLRTRRK